MVTGAAGTFWWRIIICNRNKCAFVGLLCKYIKIYVRKTNKMHLYLNNLFQLNYPQHVSNKQFNIQEVISVLAECSISHAESILQ